MKVCFCFTAIFKFTSCVFFIYKRSWRGIECISLPANGKKKSNIKAVNVNINVWNEIRWSFYTSLCKMKNIRRKKKCFPPPDRQQSRAEHPRPILLRCYLDEPTVRQPEEVWDIKQRLNNLSCRSHSRKLKKSFTRKKLQVQDQKKKAEQNKK